MCKISVRYCCVKHFKIQHLLIISRVMRPKKVSLIGVWYDRKNELVLRGWKNNFNFCYKLIRCLGLVVSIMLTRTREKGKIQNCKPRSEPVARVVLIVARVAKKLTFKEWFVFLVDILFCFDLAFERCNKELLVFDWGSKILIFLSELLKFLITIIFGIIILVKFEQKSFLI